VNGDRDLRRPIYIVSQKVSPKHLATATTNLHRLNEILYTHKTTSISVIDAKFHKIPLFCLGDFQFFQTAVTNLSYRYDLLPCWRHLWLLHLPAGQCPGPQPTVPALLSAETSRLQQPTGLATEQSRSQSGGLIRFGAFCRNESTTARSVMLTIWKNDWRLASFWLLIKTLLIEQWISGVIDCINV